MQKQEVLTQPKVGEYVFSKFTVPFHEPRDCFVAEIIGTFVPDTNFVLVRGDEKHLSWWYSDTDRKFNKLEGCVIIHKNYIVGPASSLLKELL